MAGNDAKLAKSLYLPCGIAERKREKKLRKVSYWQCPMRQRSPMAPTISTFRKSLVLVTDYEKKPGQKRLKEKN